MPAALASLALIPLFLQSIQPLPHPHVYNLDPPPQPLVLVLIYQYLESRVSYMLAESCPRTFFTSAVSQIGSPDSPMAQTDNPYQNSFKIFIYSIFCMPGI